ncbi:methylated DNA-protein cysteine methyltransferase [[Eubacterium] cellulosolvens]
MTDNKDLPKIIKCEEQGKFGPRWGLKAGDTLVIPAPIEVDAIMKTVEKGKLITTNEIRQILATKHKTTSACPMTTGIFTWIAAYAAEEAKCEGKENVTPYWRTLKTNGMINPKYPGGIEAQKMLLKNEGHKVVQKGKNYVVADFEKYLVEL